ncbi:MAG: hypothetical protein AVDCRST_MAG64-674 [uncultured Phycisphaerae bacterium]|uniref:Uncharacterized protein n=1 Tax=uncultured Phycisphaerae bacterium TaxID=904963 RepID=A0A6J4NFV5_9BACT|nr:MAG: hypothetical protein AVDCRST_MAG64-674 [uncultured Phycisphaerae bacterium]
MVPYPAWRPRASRNSPAGIRIAFACGLSRLKYRRQSISAWMAGALSVPVISLALAW